MNTDRAKQPYRHIDRQRDKHTETEITFLSEIYASSAFLKTSLNMALISWTVVLPSSFISFNTALSNKPCISHRRRINLSGSVCRGALRHREWSSANRKLLRRS